MQTRHQNKDQYFKEQIYTTEEYVIPFIENAMAFGPDTNILEIGCGEGGNLVPFLDLGCKVFGIDISDSKIDHALRFFQDHPQKDNITLIAKDIYLAENMLNVQFDLIVMRDVIEHIHDQDRFMGYVKRFLKPGAVFFLGFPPWHNPFGGHQQICKNLILSKLPYFHIFPSPVYKSLLKAGGESKDKIETLLEIKETGISIERFEKILTRNSYKIIKRKLFLFNPNYNIKFNIKPREQNGFIARIPFFRNFLTTAGYYLVTPDNI